MPNNRARASDAAAAMPVRAECTSQKLLNADEDQVLGRRDMSPPLNNLDSKLFSQLSECNTTTACSDTTPCGSGYSCVNRYCMNDSCNFELLLTTLSAHSFNYISQVPVGTYNVSTKLVRRSVQRDRAAGG